MKTLVLCIDRDNDVGEKTGLGSPIIGRKAVLDAAIELGLKDPEESDTNAILAGIKTLDNLKKEGKEAEVVLICGHKYLGEKADRAIAEQLDKVLDQIKPDRAILVSDSASDEAILPVLQSRVRVDHVRRFVVRQTADWQDKLYILMETVSDEKVRALIWVPVALIMLFYGTFALFGWPEGAVIHDIPLGMILVLLGGLLLSRAMKLQERMMAYMTVLRRDMRTAKFSPIVSLVAMVFLLFGTFFSYEAVLNQQWSETAVAIVLFCEAIIPWVVGALQFKIYGEFLDPYLRHQRVRWSLLLVALQIVAVGFIIYGTLRGVRAFLTRSSLTPGQLPFETFAFIIGGITIAVAGTVVYRYIRGRLVKDQNKV